MCLIVDTNVAALVFRKSPSPDFQPIWDWVDNKDGVIVYGGALRKELARTGARRYLRELSAAGKARDCDDATVDAEEARVKKMRLCRSNDPHVVALARVSGARVLCSHDNKLIQDFKDRLLVYNPRGSVYQRAAHKKSLKHYNGCRR